MAIFEKVLQSQENYSFGYKISSKAVSRLLKHSSVGNKINVEVLFTHAIPSKIWDLADTLAKLPDKYSIYPGANVVYLSAVGILGCKQATYLIVLRGLQIT